jgi:hypothetical protein
VKLREWVDTLPGTLAEKAASLGVKRVALHRAMAGQTMPRPATAQAIWRESGGQVTYADLGEAYTYYRTPAA